MGNGRHGKSTVFPWDLLRMKTKTEKFTSCIFLIGVLFGWADRVLAQEPVGPQLATGFDSIKEEILRADLTFLASDALQGRRSCGWRICRVCVCD